MQLTVLNSKGVGELFINFFIGNLYVVGYKEFRKLEKLVTVELQLELKLQSFNTILA